MKYLFDSSAIFKAIKENKIELLNGSHTIELAKYEPGNTIWKDHVPQAKVSMQEARMIAKAINHTLNTMNLIQTAKAEEETLDTAMKPRITVYDASYAHVAKAEGLKLITEDK